MTKAQLLEQLAKLGDTDEVDASHFSAKTEPPPTPPVAKDPLPPNGFPPVVKADSPISMTAAEMLQLFQTMQGNKPDKVKEEESNAEIFIY